MSTNHTMLYTVDGAPQQRYQLYHEEKAKGGIALTMFGGSSNVAQNSATATGILNLTHDSIIPHFMDPLSEFKKVRNNGTVPLDDLFEELRAESCNNGSVDTDRLLAGQPQTSKGERRDGYELFRVGDAVSSRDIHCSILDSRRLCKAL